MDSTWKMNVATMEGGGVMADVHITVIVMHCSFHENTASNGGALYGNGSNAFLSTACMWESNEASGMGGAVAMRSSGELHLMENSFVTNQAGTGGAVYAGSESSITSSSSVWDSNVAGAEGGAIAIHSSLVLRSTDDTYLHNNATGGGAVHAETLNSVDVMNSSFFANSAGMSGGGLALVNVAGLKIEHSEFEMNKAMEGGALFGSMVMMAEIAMTLWKHNKAEAFGGGLRVMHSLVNVLHCSFEMNSADYGGALSADNSSLVSLQSTWTRNDAISRGGAIGISSSAALNISDNSMMHNRVEKGIGGGLYSSNVAMILVMNSQWMDNTAVDGGAVGVEETEMHLSNVTFVRNTAVRGGGLFAGKHATVATITCAWMSNVAEQGGGVGAYMNSAVHLVDANFHSNKASEMGGGVAAESHSAIDLSVGRSVFVNNEGELGGAIAINMNSTVNVAACDFSDNHGGHGGALYANGASSVVITNSSLVGNRASMNGGVVAFLSGSSLHLADSICTDNSAEMGGVVFGADDCEGVLLRGTWTDNSAVQGGVFAFTSGCSVDLSDAEPSMNRAQEEGGVMFVGTSASVEASQVTCTENSAQLGGAISVATGGMLTLSNAVFERNAASYGGALSGREHAHIQLSSISWIHNQVSGDGGAVAVYSGTNMVLSDSMFENNVAGADEPFNISEYLIPFDGFLVVEGVEVNVTNATNATRNRTMGQETPVNMSRCETLQAHHHSRGGAIFAAGDSDIEIVETMWKNNTASLEGGAIAVYTGSHVTVRVLPEDEEHVNSMFTTSVSMNMTSTTTTSAETTTSPTTTPAPTMTNVTSGTFSRRRPQREERLPVLFRFNTAVRGGAVWVSESAVFDGADFALEENSATCLGGAVGAHLGSSVVLSHAAFQNNVAGVGVERLHAANMSMNMSNDTMIGATPSPTPSPDMHMTSNHSNLNLVPDESRGGAVFIANGSNLHVSGGRWKWNSAGNGGAVAVLHGGNVAISDGHFMYNSARRTGGAFYVMGLADSSLGSTKFRGNRALASEGFCEMHEGMVCGGGAVALDGDATFNLEDNSTMHMNEAILGGAVAASGHSVIKLQDTKATFNNATHGGAVYADESATVHLAGMADVSSNTAKYSGGAIYSHGGSVFVSGNVHISSNTAADKGGAVYLTAVLSFIGYGKESVVSENFAGIGGALFVADGGKVIVGSDHFVHFYKNVALENAGGAFLGSGAVMELEPEGCPATCNHTHIGDGFCDLGCFNRACNWDMQDCFSLFDVSQASQTCDRTTCSVEMETSGMCSEECATASCDWGNNACRDTFPSAAQCPTFDAYVYTQLMKQSPPPTYVSGGTVRGYGRCDSPVCQDSTAARNGTYGWCNTIDDAGRIYSWDNSTMTEVDMGEAWGLCSTPELPRLPGSGFNYDPEHLVDSANQSGVNLVDEFGGCGRLAYLFEENEARTGYGGAIYKEGCQTNQTYPETHCYTGHVDRAGADLVKFLHNHAGRRGGAIFVECNNIGFGCADSFNETFGAVMSGGIVPRILFENNTVRDNGTDVASLSTGWVQVDGVLLTEASLVATVLTLPDSLTTVTIPGGAWSGAVRVEVSEADIDPSFTPPGIIVASRVLTFFIDGVVTKPINFALGVTNRQRRAIDTSQPYVHWLDRSTDEWQVLCNTRYNAAEGIVRSNVPPSVLNSVKFKGTDGTGGRLVAFYVDEWACKERPETTQDTGTPPPVEPGFIVDPSTVTVNLPIGDGPGEIVIPPGAITERSRVALTEYDYDPDVDPAPEGEHKIASRILRFFFDKSIAEPLTFRLALLENLRRALGELGDLGARRALGKQPYVHWLDQRTTPGRWTVLCESTVVSEDGADLLEAQLDELTLNMAAFKGDDGARLAAWFRSDDVCAPPVEPEPEPDGLSGGAIAGIVIGILAGLALCAALAWFFIKKSMDAPPAADREAPLVPEPVRSDLVTVTDPAPEPEPPIMPYAIPYPMQAAPPPLDQYVVDGQFMVAQPPMPLMPMSQPPMMGSQPPMMMSQPPMMDPSMMGSQPPMMMGSQPPAMAPFSPSAVFGQQTYQLAV